MLHSLQRYPVTKHLSKSQKISRKFCFDWEKGEYKKSVWITFGLHALPSLPSTQKSSKSWWERGKLLLPYPFFFFSLLKKTIKYRNPIIFNDVPVITLQDVKTLPQTPKRARFLLNMFQRRPEQSLGRVTSCAHNHLQHTEH